MKTSLKIVAIALLGILSACGSSTEPPQPIQVGLVINPSSTNVPTAGTQTFVAEVTANGNANKSVSWKVSEAAGGTIDASGHYTAPTTPGTFHIVATSAQDKTKTFTATVNVLPVSVAVNPDSVTLATAASTSFSANVGGTLDNSVTWTVDESGGGSIDAAGNYTAPVTAGTYHLTATSTADGSKVGHATIVVQAVGVAVAPGSTTVDQGAIVALSSTITNTATTDVTWSVQEGASGGTVDASGHYTAPFHAGTYHVIATSVADGTKTATAAITVNAATLSIAPTPVQLEQGATQTFTPTFTGTTAPQATWSVSGTAGGSVDANGTYTAGTQVGTDTIVATYAADSSVTASATVTVPTAGSLRYVDPTDTTSWRFVRSSASTPGHLVLDLLGPDGGSGYGAAFSLQLGASASWSKVGLQEPTYAINRAFNLGSTPQLMKVSLQGATLSAGFYMKGSSMAAVPYSKVLASVAIDYTGSGQVSGTPIALSVVRAEARSAPAGTHQPITIQVGQLVAK